MEILEKQTIKDIRPTLFSTLEVSQSEFRKATITKNN